MCCAGVLNVNRGVSKPEDLLHASISTAKQTQGHVTGTKEAFRRRLQKAVALLLNVPFALVDWACIRHSPLTLMCLVRTDS